MLRGAWLVGTVMLAAICGGCDSDEASEPVCPVTAGLWSPCGFTSIVTTCGDGGPAACESFANGTSCSIGPVTGSCMVTVMLGDGTSHDVSVTVAAASGCGDVNVVTAPSQGFASPTCVVPVTDAAVDGPDTADGSADGANDAEDATDADGV